MNFIAHLTDSDLIRSLYIMESYGKGIIRLYWYTDDDSIAYLEGLSVEKLYRNLKIGTQLLISAENTARNFGLEEIYLWVDKDSWMYEWYKRKEYQDHKYHEEEKNVIWLKKKL